MHVSLQVVFYLAEIVSWCLNREAPTAMKADVENLSMNVLRKILVKSSNLRSTMRFRQIQQICQRKKRVKFTNAAVRSICAQHNKALKMKKAQGVKEEQVVVNHNFHVHDYEPDVKMNGE